MTEETYWRDASFTVTSSGLVYQGVTYPVATVSAAWVEHLPPDERVYTRLLLGTPLVLWGVLFLGTGVDSSIAWATVFGSGLIVAGGFTVGSGVKAIVEDRRLRNVCVSLASGERVTFAVPRSVAAEIAEAIDAAIANCTSDSGSLR
jgi:hypothetical protein